MTETEDGTDSDTTKGRGHQMVSGLRVVIEVRDWDAAIAFYRDALGLSPGQGYSNDDASQLVLDVGHASIELVHPHLPTVDAPGPSHDLRARGADGETGLGSPRLRLSFESGNAVAAVEALVEAGAQPLVYPVVVPSDSVNARLLSPEGVPMTVFQSLSGPDFSEPPPFPQDFLSNEQSGPMRPSGSSDDRPS